MTRRLERINALIRNTIGELLLSKISDPRIDPARTSVTHVEIADDLENAKVFISVMGSESQQRLAITALQHAAGHVQELMMRQIQLRSTPRLTFVLDKNFKKTLEVLRSIQEASEETRQRDLRRQESAAAEAKESPEEPKDDQ